MANICVGPTTTGTGTGADWTNRKAWSGTPVRGDTWYLIDGAYAAKTLSVGVSGTTLITIKKATVADHGGISTGWSDTLGDGVATITGTFQVNTSYWVIDGVTGGGPGSWQTGFGIVITTPTGINPVVAVDGGTSNVTFKHCELIGSNETTGAGGSIANDGFNFGCWGGSPHAFDALDHITASYCSIHDTGRCPFILGSDFTTIEYCWTGVFQSGGADDEHSETLSIKNPGTGVHDVTIRYSIITHIESTGGIACDNNDYTDGNWLIYGNVFYLDGTSENNANGVIFTWTGYKANIVKVYNNTFINVPIGTGGGYLMGFFGRTIDSGGIEFKNNLIYNSSVALSGVDSHNYNHWVSVSGGAQGETQSTTAVGDPFIDFTGYDFRLAANTVTGVDLGAPYNVDALGNTRTTWTRGAYEFSTSVARSYVKGVWVGVEVAAFNQRLTDNIGIVGVTVSANWADLQPDPDVLGMPQFFWDDLDSDIAAAKLAGFDHINLELIHSPTDLPDWLLADLVTAGVTIPLRDPTSSTPTFCMPIDTSLYWTPLFQSRRLAFIAAAGRRYANDPAIHGVFAAFCNHDSTEWEVQDAQGELHGAHCTGGPYTVDQPAQWNAAGWTRALVRQVGIEVLDATAAAFPNQVLKLPVNGLSDEFTMFTRTAVVTAGSPTVTSATANFTSADLHKRVIGYPATPGGGGGAKSIPNNTFVGIVNSATSIGLSSSAVTNTPVNATLNGDRISLPNRDPHLQVDGTVPGFATLAVEIKAYIDTTDYADRTYIQVNNVDTQWGTRQDLIDTPPTYSQDRYVKKMVADAVPTSGLRNIGSATNTSTDRPRYLQNGGIACDSSETTEECELEVMTNSCGIALDFAKPDPGILFYEISPDDASNPAFYDLILDTTIAMGGMARTSTASVPVILGPFTIDTLVGMPVHARVDATNSPTSYGAAGFPAQLGIETATGRITGKVIAEGVTVATLTAINAAGSGTALCTITATTGGGGGGGSGPVLVYAGKVWNDLEERLDYADLDDAGHVACAFGQQSIGAAQMTSSAVVNKLLLSGWAGLIGQYVLPKDIILQTNARLLVLLAQIQMPGVRQSAVVVPGELILPATEAPPDPALTLLFSGFAERNLVSLYVYKSISGNVTLPAKSRINYRVFNF